jgi:hypothetical protein
VKDGPCLDFECLLVASRLWRRLRNEFELERLQRFLSQQDLETTILRLYTSRERY